MIEFADILYGSVRLPEWIVPFLKIPEFVRLRGVRLSNVDSYQFKDFNGPSRWEHCIAVTWLALRCAERRNLSERDRVHLALAALLHDVATPPFAHTAEYVLQGFDHELQSQRLLSSRPDDDFDPDLPVFASQLPQFHSTCRSLSAMLGLHVDPDEVARMVVGDGENGFLIHGSIDLDNADNVTRACRYLGVAIDPTVPPRLVDWLAVQPCAPTDLEEEDEPAVREWLRYRGELYSRFFGSSDEELGRQAFLQHLMRRGIQEGFPRRALIWNTDERLLFELEKIDREPEDASGTSLQELVQRYRLLESPQKLAHLEVESEESLRLLRQPQCVAWIEQQLTTPTFEPFVTVASARHRRRGSGKDLFPPAPGALLVFKLGSSVKAAQLPPSLRGDASDPHDLSIHPREIARRLGHRIREWTASRPWNRFTVSRSADVVRHLDSLGNWSFRLSRNESIHPYPGTFVHAIPSGLITSLGVQGELIVDPFGGTGQTAIEAVKHGSQVVSADSNSIATLAARAKLTFLSRSTRDRLRGVSANDILEADPASIPDFDLRNKWFHANTFDELRRIRGFIDTRRDAVGKQFLLATFSAMIPACTGRHGKQHGFFADNAPLERGTDAPPYRNAVEEFLRRLGRNLNNIENFYAAFERDEKSPEVELARATVVRADIQKADLHEYGIVPHSAAAVITSPPYLCMADYALGQRLSYYLTMPEHLDVDFGSEIGARRLRSRGGIALEQYRDGLRRFADVARQMLRPGGYLATVLGTPKAKAFAEIDLIAECDNILSEAGFERLWTRWRPINWHRNHGYAHLKRERLTVYAIPE
ncbi:MAG: HD domain-containing protein [Planctomycetaceae bacterium]